MTPFLHVCFMQLKKASEAASGVLSELTSSMTERLGPRNDSLCFQSRGGLSLLCIEPAITCRRYLQQERKIRH
jgi:hypothetical protein